MGHVRRTIREVDVEMRETSQEGSYALWANGQPVLTLEFSRDEGHGRWSCPCGAYQSGKREPMLSHVVDTHVLAARQSLEARTTYLRMAGKHPDPTYDQAIIHLYGNPW
jgi:hypothetical protein